MPRDQPRLAPSLEVPDREDSPAAPSAAGEPDTVAAAAPPSSQSPAGSPLARMTLVGASTVGLFVIALGYVLYISRGIALPTLVAILLSWMFAPVVRRASRLGVPVSISALAIVLGMIAVVVVGSSVLSGPAQSWLEQAPKRMRQIEAKLRDIRRPIDKVSRATEEVQQLAVRATGQSKRPDEVVIQDPPLKSVLLLETGQFLRGLVVVTTLLFLLLASKDSLLHKLVRVLPTHRHKRVAVRAVNRVQAELSRYLLTAVAINAVLGVAVAVAMHLFGMPSAMLWGVAAGVLNFIPYLGAIATGVILAAVSLSVSPTAGQALLPPLVFFVLTGLEGHIITPMVQGRRLRLSPVVVFFSVLVWASLWGVPGALLAIPLVVTGKILCEEIEPLRPLALLMSPPPPRRRSARTAARVAPDRAVAGTSRRADSAARRTQP